MKKFKIATLGMCLLTVVSCGTNQKTGSLIGAGGGAVLGGIVGNIIGKNTKSTAIGAAIGGVVGTAAGNIIGKHMDKVAEQAKQVDNAKVETVTDANGLSAVKVTFDSGILFSTGSSTLSSSARKSLSDFAGVLKTNTDCEVAIQGYTDNQGWKNSTREQSQQKNLDLSQKRANSVTNFLTMNGVSGSQIKSTMGYGEENPVADNTTTAGKAQNRRVEVYLYASQAMVNAAKNGTLAQ
jgi:outer membrane protein OmpA-like peptidoglycan-associated protein